MSKALRYTRTKDKFIKGNFYWTYYIGLTNKGNKIRYSTDIFKVQYVENEDWKTNNNGSSNPTPFVIQDGAEKMMGKTLQYNIYSYMRGYGCSYCEFYEDYDSCAEGYDKEILDLAKKSPVSYRETLYKKLKVKTPPVSKFENSAKTWYENLISTEKKYVQFYAEKIL